MPPGSQQQPGPVPQILYVAVGNASGTILCEYVTPSSSKSSSIPAVNHTPTALKLFAVQHSAASVRQSYTADGLLFNIQNAKEISFLAICEKGYRQELAFKFLDKLQFSYGKEFTAAAPPTVVSTQSAFFAGLVKDVAHFNSPEADKIAALRKEIDEVKGVMTDNLDKILERGEKVEHLVERTNTLATDSNQFFESSRALRRRMWWKNVKLILFIVGLIAVLAFIVAVVACGGFSFKSCSGGSADTSKAGTVGPAPAPTTTISPTSASSPLPTNTPRRA